MAHQYVALQPLQTDFAERAAALNHPHLPCAIGFLQLPDKSLLLMPRGEGGSLAALLNNANAAAQLGWPRRAALAAGVASGLAYLHVQTPPISHGDVKPENVLLEEDFSPLLSDAWILSILQSHWHAAVRPT